jgi:polyhydroxybutyrate depolymerase
MPPRKLRLGVLAALAAALGFQAAASAAGTTEESFRDRPIMVYLPATLPAPGNRALVVVLHGGLGNARRVAEARNESAMNMDAASDRHGFVVAYLSGTPATRMFGPDKLGWNAGGGCCGQPAVNGVDDVGYIQAAIGHLQDEYRIDRGRTFGIGHSNGAMMIQRMACDTGVFAAAVAISGPLNLPVAACPAAQGKRILAIHGADDQNVPPAGGRGTKGISGATYNSEERTKQVFGASGAAYTLEIVGGADHQLEHIDAAIRAAQGLSVAEKAVRFFGL